MTEVVAFLTQDGWAEVNSMMNEGEQGPPDSGSGDSGAPQYQNTTAPGNSTCTTSPC